LGADTVDLDFSRGLGFIVTLPHHLPRFDVQENKELIFVARLRRVTKI